MTRILMAALMFTSLAQAATTAEDVLAGYKEVAKAMANDDFAAVQLEAGKLMVTSEDLAKTVTAEPLGGYYRKIYKAALNLNKPNGKESEYREVMSILSEGAVNLVKATPSLHSKWQLFKCPMVQGRFGYWMQPAGDPMANPYMGQSMLQCGVKKAWAKFP